MTLLASSPLLRVSGYFWGALGLGFLAMKGVSLLWNAATKRRLKRRAESTQPWKRSMIGLTPTSQGGIGGRRRGRGRN